MIKAKWVKDYDHRTDKCYDVPGCPKCKEKAFYHSCDDSEMAGFHCPSCGCDIELDVDMLKWYADHTATKTEIGTCINCGQKSSVEHYYIAIDGNYRLGYGECIKCGCRFIV